MIEGKSCRSCGAKATRRVRVNKRLLYACDRCSARVRKAGDFWKPRKTIEERKQTQRTEALALQREGKSILEIALELKCSTHTIRRRLEA